MANVRETSRVLLRSTNKKEERGEMEPRQKPSPPLPSPPRRGSLSARLKGVSVSDEATAWRSYALVAGPRQPLLFRLLVRPFDLAKEERRIVAREWPRHRQGEAGSSSLPLQRGNEGEICASCGRPKHESLGCCGETYSRVNKLWFFLRDY